MKDEGGAGAGWLRAWFGLGRDTRTTLGIHFSFNRTGCVKCLPPFEVLEAVVIGKTDEAPVLMEADSTIHAE